MKKLIIISIAIISLLMAGCKKNDNKDDDSNNNTVVSTKIYGTVFNASTIEPIHGAQVEFCTARQVFANGDFDCFEIISSSISGSDGQYEIEFNELPYLYGGYHYVLRVTCTNYISQIVTLTIIEGSTSRVDINIIPAN